MAAPDKIEAVQKVSNTLSQENFPNKDHFDHFMSSTSAAQGIKPSSFERIDTKVYGANEVQSVEPKPVFGDENVTAQKTGTATDEERKRRQQQESTEIEGVSETRTKGSSTQSASLLDQVSKLNKNLTQISSASPESLKTQAKEMVSQIEQVKTQLANNTGEIKPSYQTLLKNRITHIDDSLKIALNKAGLEYTPPPIQTGEGSSKNGVKTFLGFLTNSQNQLQNLDNVIEKLSANGQITPANMIAIQMKMGYVQQQIELFTSLLNKALESTKTIMNVQV